MNFASLPFVLFLPTVFGLYWAYANKRYQNLVLVLASLFFYGWWDLRFLSLIIASAVLDYWIGILLSSRTEGRSIFLAISLIFNLGMLALFKYFDFFSQSLSTALHSLGISAGQLELNLILPIGISFYTFQTLSYSIDVYRNKCKCVRDPIQFLAFVTFFPQLVAGPIERATKLLPQFGVKREFDSTLAADGCRQALWGFFKKMVVADTAAAFVNPIFSSPEQHSPTLLLFAAFFFSIQIYCDFSGYSDIAIGVAKTFGVQLSRNFSTPYFARSIREFWTRWHISLSTWFRDYVYVPLGGNKVSKLKWYRNVWIVFLVSGLWHGANWTFVVWGAIHAIFFFVLGGKKNQDTHARFRDIPQIGATFFIVALAWVFFRADSIADAWAFLTHLTHVSLYSLEIPPKTATLSALIVLVVEWFRRHKSHVFEDMTLSAPLRWAIYYALTLLIFIAAKTGGDSFIYFQF